MCDQEENSAGERAQKEKTLKDEMEYAYKPCVVSFRKVFIQVPCLLQTIQHAFDLPCDLIRKV